LGLFGAILFIPLFIQAVQGDNATNSGNAVTPMTLAIVVSSIVTGQIISRTGKYRIIGIVGMALVTVGMFLLYTMNMDTDRLTTISYMILMGLGLGIAFPLYTLVVQNAFPIQQVGVVTAAVTFFRSIGSTVGVALLGSVVNSRFHEEFREEFSSRATAQGVPPQFADNLVAGLNNLNPQVLVGAEGAERLHQQLTTFIPQQFAAMIPAIERSIFDAMKPSLFTGIQEAFLIGTVVVAVGFVTTAFLKEIPLRKTNAPVGPAASSEQQGTGDGSAPGGLAALAEGYEPVAEDEERELVAR
jgi:MFS family permease